MKYALISPIEPREEGYRVAEVSAVKFEVALPFYWEDCNDDIIADIYWFNPVDKTFSLIPEPVVGESQQPVVNGAQTL